ncbi:McrB family protein [Kordia jejudonensis]|uniref:McrB family protein n=1 Tax=Kordia jejudonensis TaxID=1348245 RepID=UPI00069C094B|nr:AAA family ATPase [Kordia jejudonensis]
MKQFTWIPFFREIEDKIYIISRESNRDERLISALHEVEIKAGLSDEEKGQKFPLQQIDPFSFLAMFLKYGVARRITYFRRLKEDWRLSASVPKDFDGLPSANARKTWLFPYKDERGVNDISTLWLLFRQLHERQIDDEVFRDVLKIKNVGFTRLTQCLFWFAPEDYLPIDAHTKPFLEDYNISTELNDLPKDYYTLMKAVSDKFTRTYYEISVSAVEQTRYRQQNLQLAGKKDTNDLKPLVPQNFKGKSLLDDSKSKQSTNLSSETEDTHLKNNYYCVAFYKGADETQYNRFIEEGIWESGYDEKFSKEINNVQVGDQIALKTAYNGKGANNKTVSTTKIFNIGTVVENPKNGKTLKVDWQENFEPFELQEKGIYRKTISKVQNDDNIDLIFRHQQQADNAENEEIPSLGVDVSELALNTILYGPPGTGKTYKLQKEYFPLFTTKKEQVTRKQYVENIISELSWWEVIALTLLDIGRPSKVADIKKHEFIQTKNGLSEIKSLNARIWSQLQTHTIEESATVNISKRSSTNLIFDKTEDSFWFLVEKAEELTENLEDILNEIKDYTSQSAANIKRYKFVSFHQSFSYEDFIEGIKPVMSTEDAPQTEIVYEIQKGAFKQLCELAEKDPNNPYALFIDEINRGNISNIFGELITLIEKDKRKGEPNELNLALTYSKKTFSVPNNVYIIGTMNTADRSVEVLDNALRRRFAFVEMLPDYEVLQAIEDIDTKYLLETINNRLIALLDREHQIGHSYFMNLDTMAELMEVFNKKIIPLLQEYFYNDYDKIGMVLGDDFVKRRSSDVKFASNYSAEDEPEINTTYELVYHYDSETFVQALQSAGLQVTEEA